MKKFSQGLGNHGSCRRLAMALLPSIIVSIGGVVLLIWYIYTNLMGMTASYTRVTVPGQIEIQFSKLGSYTIFHEYVSTFGGSKFRANPGAPGLECGMISLSTNKEVDLETLSGSYSYTLFDSRGVGLWSFKISNPGDYLLDCAYKEGMASTETVLAIGQSFLSDLTWTIAGGFGIMVLTVLLGIIFFLLGLKRGEVKKDKSSQGPGGPKSSIPE